MNLALLCSSQIGTNFAKNCPSGRGWKLHYLSNCSKIALGDARTYSGTFPSKHSLCSLRRAPSCSTEFALPFIADRSVNRRWMRETGHIRTIFFAIRLHILHQTKSALFHVERSKICPSTQSCQHYSDCSLPPPARLASSAPRPWDFSTYSSKNAWKFSMSAREVMIRSHLHAH